MVQSREEVDAVEGAPAVAEAWCDFLECSLAGMLKGPLTHVLLD